MNNKKEYFSYQIKNFLNLLFPFECTICKTKDTEQHVCNNCWNEINFIDENSCYICSNPVFISSNEKLICAECLKNKPHYTQAKALMKYDARSKKIIKNFKYFDQLHLLNYLSNLLVSRAKNLINECHFIIPVPMHKFKFIRRGYNQASLLAGAIAISCNKPYIANLLIKNKNTKAQSFLNKKERQKNIKNSIILNKKYLPLIKNKKILLVDDVITTGATINECSKTLKLGSPEQVYVLSLAKRV